ncbi:MAG: N-acetyltransferase DgcN [Pseudomonadota bacterium]
MQIQLPYLLFLGDAPDQLAAKTADGIARWRPENAVGQMKLPGCNADVGITDMTLEEGVAAGAKTLVLGVANRGGKFSDTWTDVMLKALNMGMDIASGLHSKVADIPEVAAKAKELGRAIHDVRHATGSFDVGSGIKRKGLRLLAVGTDCSVGKMYTTLALEKEMKSRGFNCDFRATGQTGILIHGSGISIDAVVADFISGVGELLSPENSEDHWDLVEGQGSLFHASYAGVSMGLLHGSQADALVMCHEPTRPHMRGLPEYELPDIGECITLNEQCARRVNPAARVIGISVNTAGIEDEAKAKEYLDKLANEHDMPAVDPVRMGVGPIVEVLEKEWPTSLARAS